MLIDWFTVGAQVLNFLILVWLMKRFLYQPVLNAIDAREKRISDQIADASAKQAQADAEKAEFQGKNTAFEQQRAAMLSKATSDAQTEAKRLMETAVQVADALSAKRAAALAAQALKINQALANKAGQEVFAISKKLLSDLASQDLEAHIVEVFVTRVHALSGTAKAALGDAFKAGSDSAVVRSAFELTSAQCGLIQSAFDDVFQATIPLRFERAPESVCGIALSIAGQKLEWSISQYLHELETDVAKLLTPGAQVQQTVQADSESSSAPPTPAPTPMLAQAPAKT